MTAEESMIDLIKPGIMDQIPSFIKKFVLKKNFRQIEKEFPDLYAAFSREGGPDENEKAQMLEIINVIFEKQIHERRIR